MTLSLRANADGSGVILLNGSPKINLDPAGNIVGTLTPPSSDTTKKLANTEFVRGSMGNYRKYLRMPADLTALTADMAGSMIHITREADAHLLTLPPLSSMQPGDTFTFLNTDVKNARFAPAAGDTVFIGPDGYTTELTALDTGSSWTLVAGKAGWMTQDGTVLLAHSAKFKSLRALRGYQVLPSGLIIQWGNDATHENGTTVSYYPIPFPNDVFFGWAQWSQDGDVMVRWFPGSDRKTQLKLDNSGTGSGRAYWVAIGY